MSEATTSAATSPTPKVPKRAQIACTYCRRRKLKCISPGDESPCDRCKASGKDCHYEPVNPPPAGDALPTFNISPNPYPASPSYTTSQGDTPWNPPILNPGYSQGQVSGFPPSTGGYQGPYPGHYPPPNPTPSHVGQPPMFPPPQSLYPQGRYPPPNPHAQHWTENPAQSNSGANSAQGFYGQVPYSSTSHGDYPGSGGAMPMDYPYYSQSNYHDKDYGHSGGR
ncbi:unnamed protein product [Cyclocybe aegerita]|uniref:Zn(2)-C6 fungal-type domain-containing protein n=1 Tax=Cyclocybe aegerita TaxID=1973307 RepID=A0A8S0W722_CYCAE|nr:unnamed protein product [Cyclocybe aegerita]